MTELELIQSIKKGENLTECLRELDEMHSGIFYLNFNSILRGYKNGQFGAEVSDFEDSKIGIVYSCAKSFDESRGFKFSTFYSKSVKHNAISLKKSFKKKENHFSMDSSEEFGFEFVDAEDSRHTIDRATCKEIFNKLRDNGHEKCADYSYRYYIRGEKLQEIADSEGKTKERVRQVIFSGFKNLRQDFNLHFLNEIR